jgi:hypothetical protein
MCLCVTIMGYMSLVATCFHKISPATASQHTTNFQEHMFFSPERIDHVRQMILAESKEERMQALSKLFEFQKARRLLCLCVCVCVYSWLHWPSVHPSLSLQLL